MPTDLRQTTVQLNESAAFDFYPVRPLTPEERIPLMLVLPGGGYLYISLRESGPVALRLNTQYLHAAVLRYTTARDRHVTIDDLVGEVRATLDWLSERAGEYQIDTGRISVIGFSAGGNLAAHCSNRLADRIHKTLLVYPATSFPDLTPADLEPRIQRLYARVSEPSLDADRIRRTMVGLLTGDPTREVSGRTRPTFIFQTGEDTTIDPMGTLSYALALRKHQVPFELFYCQKGPHGLSLADETCIPVLLRHQARWFELAMEWLKDQDAIPLPS